MFWQWKPRAKHAERERNEAVHHYNELAEERDEWRALAQARDRFCAGLNRVARALGMEDKDHFAPEAVLRKAEEVRAELARVTERCTRAWHAIEEASDAFREPIADIKAQAPGEADVSVKPLKPFVLPDVVREAMKDAELGEEIDAAFEVVCDDALPPFRPEPPPDGSFAAFTEQVEAAGLTACDCRGGHWQIQGGQYAVTVWPFKERGFTLQRGQDSWVTGDTQKAIAEALRETA